MRSRQEFYLQQTIITMIELDYPLFRVSAIPNGGYRNEREAVNLKRSGVRAGEPDLILRLPGGVTWNLEIKTDKGKQSATQKQCQRDCERLGHPYFVIRSVDELKRMLYEQYGEYYRKVQ